MPLIGSFSKEYQELSDAASLKRECVDCRNVNYPHHAPQLLGCGRPRLGSEPPGPLPCHLERMDMPDHCGPKAVFWDWRVPKVSKKLIEIKLPKAQADLLLGLLESISSYGDVGWSCSQSPEVKHLFYSVRSQIPVPVPIQEIS